jgi:hypothetical protein
VLRERGILDADLVATEGAETRLAERTLP